MIGAKEGLILFERTVRSLRIAPTFSEGSKCRPKVEIEGMGCPSGRLKNADFRDADVSFTASSAAQPQNLSDTQ